MKLKNNYIITVVGPTAAGKTALSVELAKHFNCEILSADSRQFYKELSIGTAKPSAEEMQGIKHHFVDSLSIHEIYDAGQFEKDALKVLEDIFKKSAIAIVVGGSGMYIKALTDGFDDMPSINPELREILNATPLPDLQKQLQELDPAYFETVDRQNGQRLVRALEVCLSTGKTYSSFRKKTKVERPFQVIPIGVSMERPALYERIDNRMDLMLKAGLLDEAKSMSDYQNLYALQTVGYTEIFRFLDGEYDWNETVRLLKRNSRRYAKRQLTWFKKDETVHWFEPTELDKVQQYILAEIQLAEQS